MKPAGNCVTEVMRQAGVALLAGLIMLAAISLLALAASSSMIMQKSMAGNFSDSQRARQAAALAVAQGRRFLFSIGHDGRIPSCSVHCFVAPLNTVIRQAADIPANPEYEDASWWQSWATEIGVDPLSGDHIDGIWDFDWEPPRFLIEEIDFDDSVAQSAAADAPSLEGVGYYRILGRGIGKGPATVAVSEAIIARPWLRDAPPDTATPDSGSFCTPFDPWYDCGVLAWRQRR